MRYTEIKTLLDYSTASILIERDPPPNNYLAAIFLSDPSNSIAAITEDTLCFGSCSQFNKVPDDILEGGTYFLYLDEDPKPFPPNVCFVAFEDPSEMRKCYENLSNEFRALRRLKDGVYGLTALLSKGAGIKAIVNHISTIFNMSACVFDQTFFLLAKSSEFPNWLTDKPEEKTGYLSESVIRMLKQKGFSRTHAPKDVTVCECIEPLDKARSFMTLMPITIDSTYVGTIAILPEDAPLRESRVELLPIIAKIISAEMQKTSTHLLNKSSHYSHLFQSLLRRDINDETELQHRFEVFGYKMRHYKRIFFIDVSRDYFDSMQLQTIATRFHHLLENNFYIVSEDSIILFSSTAFTYDEGACGRTEPAMIQEMNAIVEITKATNIAVGVSSSFTNLRWTSTYLEQAKRAITTGRKYDQQGPLYHYSNYRYEDLIEHIDDKQPLHIFRYPPLMRLIEEDMRHGTNLTYTLLVYLQNPNNPKQVAEKLFIHKNTLYYRLNRINQIMGVNLHNAEILMKIELTFLILKHERKLQELIFRKEPIPPSTYLPHWVTSRLENQNPTLGVEEK